jgi:hypothetical protein
LEKNFKSIIISHVRNEEMSISRLAREMAGEGYKIHRLYLTGYLKALADMGILKEKDIPPSKVYSTSANLDKTIYESVGEKCLDLEVPESEKVRVAIFVLQRLFKRPVFLSEIKECGIEGTVVGTVAPPEEKDELRAHLLKAGIKIPNNDPAYMVNDDYDSEFESIVQPLLVEKFNAGPLIVDTKQTKLDDMAQREPKKKGKSHSRARARPQKSTRRQKKSKG